MDRTATEAMNGKGGGGRRMMTARHYELIARVVRGSKNLKDEEIVHLALRFVKALEADNPRFKREKFLEACGIELGGWRE